MGLYEQFPYTNLHELNLDWIINEIKKLGESISDVDFTIKYADPIQWNINTAYDKYTLVTDGLDSTYLSLRAVPAGVDIADTSFWTLVGDFYGMLQEALDHICTNQMNRHSAIKSYQAGEIFWMDYYLYRAKENIPSGAPITTEGLLANAEEYTLLRYINSLLDDIRNSLDETIDAYERMANDIYMSDNELYVLPGSSFMDGFMTSSSAAWVLHIPIARRLDNVNSVTLEGTCTGIGRLATGGYVEASNVEISQYVDSATLLKEQQMVRLVLRKTGGWKSGGNTIANNASASFQVVSASSMRLRFSE